MIDYEQRNLHLIKIGFQSYEEYLSSSLWRRIRRNVIKKINEKCEICGDMFTQIHHKDYSIETLLGKNLNSLMPICNTCHNLVEFSDSGKKNSLKQANSMILQLKNLQYCFKKKKHDLCYMCKKRKIQKNSRGKCSFCWNQEILIKRQCEKCGTRFSYHKNSKQRKRMCPTCKKHQKEEKIAKEIKEKLTKITNSKNKHTFCCHDCKIEYITFGNSICKIYCKKCRRKYKSKHSKTKRKAIKKILLTKRKESWYDTLEHRRKEIWNKTRGYT